MINFIRKICKKSGGDNQASKYMRDAAGEIVQVVMAS